MRELFETQTALLPTAVSLAAGNCTELEVQQLRRAVEQCESAATLEGFFPAVADFGTAVLKASHNRVLDLYGELSTALIGETLYDFASSAGFTFESLEAFFRRATRLFSTIVDLIEAREPDRAEELCRNELTRASAALWPEPAPLELYRSSDPKRERPTWSSAKSRKRARNLRAG
jgi:DNA-binding FadR family transcriptional regulator